MFAFPIRDHRTDCDIYPAIMRDLIWNPSIKINFELPNHLRYSSFTNIVTYIANCWRSQSVTGIYSGMLFLNF